MVAIQKGTGAPNGPSRSLGTDGWFRYPAGFSADAINRAVQSIGCDAGELLVDPFAGAAVGGSSLVERGVRFRGLEANVLVAELANLKFMRPGPPTELTEVGDQVSAAPEGTVQNETDLVKACFSEASLRQLVGIRTQILSEEERWRAHLKWALLATLRDVATAKVGWPYQRPDVARTAPHTDVRSRFRHRVASMAASLEAASSIPDGIVQHGDARKQDAWSQLLADERAVGCLTSPPYLNNYDYADATRLEAYFWGAATTWSELVSVVRAPMMIATTQQTSVSRAADARTKLAQGAPRTFSRIEALSDQLAVQQEHRSRPKEYDRLVLSYFADALVVLQNLWDNLADGARVAMVIGDSAPYATYIDTPALWSSIASELGFSPVSDLVIRSRGLRWRTNGSRHQVDLHERLVLWSRPGTD